MNVRVLLILAVSWSGHPTPVETMLGVVLALLSGRNLLCKAAPGEDGISRRFVCQDVHEGSTTLWHVCLPCPDVSALVCAARELDATRS